MPTNYLVRNGDVYDGSGDPGARLDIRIHGPEIVEIGPNLPSRADTDIDATGLIVAPGLIDLHVHVFTGMGIYSISPEEAGLRTGVTTMLDTGTVGTLGFPAFHRFVLTQSREDVYALLNISNLGVQGYPEIDPYIGELSNARYLHVPSAVACIDDYRDRILGTKVRLSAGLADNNVENERMGLQGAVEAAAKTGLPCMVHHSGSQIPVAEVLETLRPGDIYTHCFHPRPDSAFLGSNAGAWDAVRRGRDRGIHFDVGHGVGSFGWEIAETACLEKDFWPDSISTDLHKFNLQGPVYDLPTTMSKFLHLGMPLARVIHATTQAPARAMGLDDRFGLLKTGRQADITIMRLEQGKYELVDVLGETRVAKERLVPESVFKRGARA